MQTEDGLDQKSRAPAVTRAASILDALAAEAPAPLGPSELARRLGLPKSSVINLCTALVDAGLAQRRNGGFALGARLVELGAAYLSSIDLVREFYDACSIAENVADETVQLAVLADGLDVVYLGRRMGRHPVRLVSDIGRHLPANCTATGKVLLAQLSPEAFQARVPPEGPLPKLTRSSIDSVEDLAAELTRVRERGYAIDDQETTEGVMCVAAAVPAVMSYDGRAAVSITVLKAADDGRRVERLAAAVKRIAESLGHRLGRVDGLQGPHQV